MLEQNPLYLDFKQRADETGSNRAMKLADQLVRQAIDKNPTASFNELEPIIQMSLDFLEFDAFWEIASDLSDADLHDVGTILNLFREWQIVEAKEMSRVTEGRIATIEKLQDLIDRDALEVPTLHNFLREFPWVIDPRWTLVDDEVTYSRLLRQNFPESPDVPESDRRIDFLCVREGTNLVVVEIKRPGLRASMDQLSQIEEQVSFMRDFISRTTDGQSSFKTVTGYLLCGNMVDTYKVRERRINLSRAGIYVRLYTDLLSMVQRVHREFIKRYDELKSIRVNGN